MSGLKEPDLKRFLQTSLTMTQLKRGVLTAPNLQMSWLKAIFMTILENLQNLKGLMYCLVVLHAKGSLLREKWTQTTHVLN